MVLGGVALIAVIVAAVFWMTAGLTDAARDFLTLVSQGRVGEAYETCTSESLRKAETQESFASGVRAMGLTEWASSSWTSRRFENSVGELEGTITTRTGGRIPLKMQFVKEGGKWKVSHCTTTPAGVSGRRPALPPEAEIRRLATRTLLEFNDALQKRNFAPFRENCAAAFRKEYPADAMKRSFQAFMDQKADLSGVANATAEFEQPPLIDDKNMLVMRGRYPTTPMNVHFGLRYIKEGELWRLAGIDLNLKRAQP